MDRSKYSKIANACYNTGLQRAKEGDLSGACEYLKTALRLDKYQIDARNLLGLIYYETGETGDALVEWVISAGLRPEDNRAEHYLDEVQRKPAVLEKKANAIQKFNQALKMARLGDQDFAMIELNHLLTDNPEYLKAHTLLALLYLEAGEHRKAGRELLAVLKKDRFNRQATALMEEVKQRTGKAEIETKRMEYAFSHRQMEDDDILLPHQKRQATADQVVLFLIIGVAIGLLAFYTLILPGLRKKYLTYANNRISENSRDLSNLNAKYSELEQKYEDMEKGYNTVSQKLRAFEEENSGFASQYQLLTSIMQSARSGAFADAARTYVGLNRENIDSELLGDMLQDVDRSMMNDVYPQLTTLGSAAWNSGRKELAEEYYDLALSIRPDDPEAMYLKARLLQSEDRTTEANAIFDRIVNEHPDNPYAQRAVTARGY